MVLNIVFLDKNDCNVCFIRRFVDFIVYDENGKVVFMECVDFNLFYIIGFVCLFDGLLDK